MKCKKCQQELLLKAKYCPNCGCQVIKKSEVTKKNKFYSREIIDNKYSDQSRLLFFVGFFGFDIVLSTVLAYLQVANLWVFILSGLIYIGVIWLSLKGLKYAYKLAHRGLEASGAIVATVMMIASLAMIYTNVSSLINYL